MKDILKKNKIKIVITLVLILFLLLLLNTKNIYKLLKGNASTKTGEPSTLITNDMINSMKTYDILAEVQGHNEDGNLKNFLFGDESIPIFNLDSAGNANVYKMKIVLKFQANHEKNGNPISKQAKISLKEGINLINNGSSEVLPYLKNKDGKSIKHSNQAVINCFNLTDYKSTSLKRNNGDILYDFDSSVEVITFNITFYPDGALDFSDIKDAIKIELIEDEEIKNTKVKSVKEDFSGIPVAVNGSTRTNNLGALGKKIESYNFMDNIAGLSSYKTKARYVVYEYIKTSVRVPKNVNLIGTRSAGMSVANIGYEHKGIDSNGKLLENYNPDIGLQNTKIDVAYEGDYKIYTFTASDIYSHCYGVIPVWDFSSYSVGDVVTVEGINVVYKTYGGEEQVVLLNENNISSKNIYTIVDKEQIKNGITSYTLYTYDEDFPDEEVHLGTYKFYNFSPYVSSPKNLSYKFDEDFAVSSITIPIFDDNNSFNVSYKKKWFDEKDKIWKVDEDFTTINVTNLEHDKTNDRAILKKENLGLTDNQYISELKFNNLNIPAYYEIGASEWHYTFYGKILDDSKEKFELKMDINNADNTTCEEGECFSGTITGTIDKKIKRLTAAPLLKSNSSKTFLSNSTANFSFIIKETKDKNALTVRKTYNPIIYIRSETGLPITNVVLSNNTGENLIEKYDLDIESYGVESTSDNKKKCEVGKVCIYKIDTKNVPSEEVVIGIDSHHYKYNYDETDEFAELQLNLTFDIDIPIDFSDGVAIHKFNDMIFVADQKSNETNIFSSTNQKGDPYDVDLDGITKDDTMSYMNNLYYYQIVSNKDLTSIVMQKQSNEEDYKIWKTSEDNSSLSNSNKLDLRLELINNSGKKITSADQALLYITIPKKGENWGDLSNDANFNLSLKLLEKLNINNKENINYDVYYGINIEPKMDFNSLKEIDIEKLVHEDNIKEEHLKDINFVVIKIKEFETNNKVSIDLKLDLLDEKQHEIVEQQFKYALYRNLSTSEGEQKSGFVLGNVVGVTNELSKYQLTVVHEDIYGKILDTEISTRTYNEEYITSKKDFENYEIFLEPTNSKGIIKEDTKVTYVYKSTLNRKVIVHYYEKGTKNKLLEDKVLTGKDLEAFEIKPEIIKGYKVVDGKEIKGSFKEKVQEFIYEYEKEVIIVPSTLDNIISNVIIFVVSIISIILIAIYVGRKKKQK